MPIKFGTDGWRAIIAEEFTFENVRLVAQAIADYILEASEGFPSVAIGFDTRFLSDRFAIEVARVLAANGIAVHLARADCPTPALSYAVRSLGAAGGVMITASHNPPRYNGIKLKTPHGSAAGPAQSRRVEEHLAANLQAGRRPLLVNYEEALAQGLIRRFDPAPAYLAHLRSLVDMETIARGGLRVVVDVMHGAGRGYMARLLEEAGCEAREIRGEMNPGFGGIHPEPIERYLGALIEEVANVGWDVGLATDGDADRIGAVDARGRFIDPHRIFALALRYLVEERGWRGAVVKTVSTTRMVDRLAERYGLPLYETPVGFHHIAEIMLSRDVLIGGEESGGITIKGHIPEGDGILMGLLLLEIMATYGQPLHAILAELMEEVGPFYYARRDLRLRAALPKAEMVKRLKTKVPARIGGVEVVGVEVIDGIKYLLADESWLLIRPSGTEPVLRVYAEARRPKDVERLLEFGETLATIA